MGDGLTRAVADVGSSVQTLSPVIRGRCRNGLPSERHKTAWRSGPRSCQPGVFRWPRLSASVQIQSPRLFFETSLSASTPKGFLFLADGSCSFEKFAQPNSSQLIEKSARSAFDARPYPFIMAANLVRESQVRVQRLRGGVPFACVLARSIRAEELQPNLRRNARHKSVVVTRSPSLPPGDS